uniref:DUF1336 domain-containing protein n=1 Tax=Ascaris lumbricoides TaxID=6252 RepID=A0A0M3I948_ASCLU
IRDGEVARVNSRVQAALWQTWRESEETQAAGETFDLHHYVTLWRVIWRIFVTESTLALTIREDVCVETSRLVSFAQVADSRAPGYEKYPSDRASRFIGLAGIMANRRPLEGSKSWLSSVVGNITGMWESMKSSSTPNRDRLDSRNSTNGHHDAGSEGDVQGRRSSSAHERGSSSFLGRMRRRSTVEATVNTGGQSEHLDEDDHEGRSSSFQEKSSFSFLGRIGRRSSSERLGSTDCQRKSFGGDSVSETRSSLQSGGSSSFLSQIRRLSGAERTAGADYRRESPSEEDFEEGRSSSLLSSYRRRNQGEHSENTDSQHSPVSKDGTYERLLSQKSPSTFLSRIRRHSKGDDTVITATPFLYATAQGSDGVVKSSRSGRIAHTARASAMRIGKDSSVCGAPDSSGSMGDVSASPSSQEEITIVAHNPRKRVHEREQLERSENIFLLETSGANVTFPKKFRKIAAEQSDLHQAGSAVAHPQFNFPKDQKFPTIFSSSAAQLVSSDSEHNDHGCSSPRTLSSRTKSILDGLDKVGSPLVVCDLYFSHTFTLNNLQGMNAHKWRFTDEPEQWASDLLNSSVQKPPANTGRTISRGNVVSDAISHSVRHNHKRRRISRQQTRAIRSSGVTASSVHVTPQRSSSKQPSPMSSKKLTPVKVTAPPRVESASLIKPLKQILRHTDRNSTSAANNNFSAKWAELGVVRHEDISTQTTSIEFQPVTANVETAHYARPLSLPERMFDFTNAQRRAPSESFIVEDAHTAEVESRQLSGHNRHRSEAESELVLDSSKKAAAAKNSSLQKG